MITATATPSSSVSLVPDNAPFTEAQRGWLNGFFAGLLNGALNNRAAAPSGAPVAEPVPEEEPTPWHDPSLSMDERLKLASGKRYPLQLMAAMAQLDCGSCGYLCKSYAEAIANGSEKDLTKCTPGGRETARMLKQLQQQAPAQEVAPPVQRSAGTAAPKAPGTYDRTNPFVARLLACTRLNVPGSEKDTRHVEISLKGSGMTYRPGDALGVFPENCPEEVQRLLQALGATGAEEITGWDDQPTSLREALHNDFTITRPSPDLIDLLARAATDSGDRSELMRLRDSDEGSDDLQILDLLRRFPSARPAPGDFIATLSPLAPRLYSISSSLSAYPEQVHLTVGIVRYTNSQGRPCAGVASTFLADRVRPGQRVRVFVQPSHRFALPADDKPIIMVGPGTGIAPFRAFLQERRITRAAGQSWLFFGDQRSQTDFLYRDELEQHLRDGSLTRLDTAFSRDQSAKVYVQHRMLERAAELWQWLQRGAYFYVCGDAKRMARDVDAALRQVVASAGGLSGDQTDAYIAELTRNGRYQRDVY